MSGEAGTETIDLVAGIVSAYVGNNSVSREDLPALIASVHASLASIASGTSPAPEAGPEPVPAVSIRRSITPEYLISLEDGRKYKTLKRHLAGLGLTPDQYRAKWGLRPDYPMVAPDYAARRSALAKESGLGQLRRKAVPAPEPVEPASAPKKRSRKAKAAA